MSNLVAAPDGLEVQLNKVNEAGGIVGSPIATARTAAGRYTVSGSCVGCAAGPQFAVRVVTNGVPLNAAVHGVGDVNVGPEAEAVFQLISTRLTRSLRFSDASTGELKQLVDAADMYAEVKSLAAVDGDPRLSVNTIRDGLEADLSAYFSALVAPGESVAGPGDFGNFFPLQANAQWTFSQSSSNAPTVAYFRQIDSAASTGDVRSAVARQGVGFPGPTGGDRVDFQKSSTGVRSPLGTPANSFDTVLKFPMVRGVEFESAPARTRVEGTQTINFGPERTTLQSYGFYTPPRFRSVRSVTLATTAIGTTPGPAGQQVTVTRVTTNTYAECVGLVTTRINTTYQPSGLTGFTNSVVQRTLVEVSPAVTCP